MDARAPHTSTDNKNKPTLSRAPRRQCRAYSTKKKSPLDRGSRLTVRGVGGRSPPGVVVWRTCRNSQHESHSLAEVIKDVSGCAIEGRFIGIPPHDGVDLAEGEWRLCTTRCSPPRTSVVCRASSSTPTSNRTIHHVRERPLLLCGVGGLVGVYSRPVIGGTFLPTIRISLLLHPTSLPHLII